MKNIKLILAGLVLLSSCSYYDRYELDNLVPEKYQKILYLSKDGKKDVPLYITGEDNAYRFSVFKGGSKPELTAEAQMNIMTQEEVDRIYNDVEGEKYRVIENDCFSSDGEHISFSSEDNYKVVTLNINPEKVKSLMENSNDPEVKWVLPINISSDVDSVNANKNKMLLYFPSVEDAYMGFTEMWNENFTREEIKHTYRNQFTAEKVIKFGLVTENRWDINCSIIAEGQDYVDEYNKTHNTNFKLMPEGIYTIPESVTLKAGNNIADIEVKVDCSSLDYNTKYILPIKVTNPTKFDVDQSSSIYPFVVSVSLPEINRTDWEITASAVELSGDYSAANLLDGDNKTIWHSVFNVNGLPYEIIIDTKNTYTFTHLGIIQRQDRQDLKGALIQISNDRVNWTDAGHLSFERSKELQTKELQTHITGQYVKLIIDESYMNNGVTSFAELYLYGLEGESPQSTEISE